MCFLYLVFSLSLCSLMKKTVFQVGPEVMVRLPGLIVFLFIKTDDESK